MKTIAIWECEYCGSQYYDESKCDLCESKCKEKMDYQYIKEFDKRFPKCSDKDTDIEKFCVDCDVYLPHSTLVFGGRRCSDCIKKLKAYVGRAIALLEEKEKTNESRRDGEEQRDEERKDENTGSNG